MNATGREGGHADEDFETGFDAYAGKLDAVIIETSTTGND